MKVAVFLPNLVGDVVMATPALRALREHFATATLLGVMRPYVGDVLAGSKLLDGSIFDTGRGLTRGLVPLARRLRYEFVDTAILFTNSFRTALAAWLGRCQQRIGYHRDARGWMLTQRLAPVMRMFMGVSYPPLGFEGRGTIERRFNGGGAPPSSPLTRVCHLPEESRGGEPKRPCR